MTCCAGAALALALTAAPVAADPPPAQAPAGRYVLDPARSSLAARIPLFGGVARTTVRFNRLEGGYAYDPATWRATRVAFDVDPRSATASQAAIARRIVADLDPDRHGRIRFVSTGVTGPADGPRLEGRLTLRGVTRPIVLDVAVNDAGAGPDGRPRMSFEGSGRIRRSHFGLTAGRPFAGEEVDLLFKVEFVRQ